MNEAWRIKKGILVSDKILIFSLFVGCFYHKGPALNKAVISKHKMNLRIIFLMMYIFI